MKRPVSSIPMNGDGTPRRARCHQTGDSRSQSLHCRTAPTARRTFRDRQCRVRHRPPSRAICPLGRRTWKRPMPHSSRATLITRALAMKWASTPSACAVSSSSCWPGRKVTATSFSTSSDFLREADGEDEPAGGSCEHGGDLKNRTKHLRGVGASMFVVGRRARKDPENGVLFPRRRRPRIAKASACRALLLFPG